MHVPGTCAENMHRDSARGIDQMIMVENSVVFLCVLYNCKSLTGWHNLYILYASGTRYGGFM